MQIICSLSEMGHPLDNISFHGMCAPCCQAPPQDGPSMMLIFKNFILLAS